MVTSHVRDLYRYTRVSEMAVGTVSQKPSGFSNSSSPPATGSQIFLGATLLYLGRLDTCLYYLGDFLANGLCLRLSALARTVSLRG